MVVDHIEYFLEDGKNHSNRDHDDLDPQSSVVERRVIATIVLRTDHQSGDYTHDPHRDANTALASFFAVQLDPGVVYWMIADGECVDRRPKTPARPLPDERMY